MDHSFFIDVLLLMLETKVCQDLRLEALIVRRALARMILYFPILASVGEALTNLSAFLRFRMTALQSSLNQMTLCFTTPGLLLGILLFAIYEVQCREAQLAAGRPPKQQSATYAHLERTIFTAKVQYLSLIHI